MLWDPVYWALGNAWLIVSVIMFTVLMALCFAWPLDTGE